mmetsp:Transcript_51667/g.117540  ORF Transcript_51667/g.117540 Transcript_51667/m.117540 type:complete len:206 (-) Transcript_51667:66-683(-)
MVRHWIHEHHNPPVLRPFRLRPLLAGAMSDCLSVIQILVRILEGDTAQRTSWAILGLTEIRVQHFGTFHIIWAQRKVGPHQNINKLVHSCCGAGAGKDERILIRRIQVLLDYLPSLFSEMGRLLGSRVRHCVRIRVVGHDPGLHKGLNRLESPARGREIAVQQTSWSERGLNYVIVPYRVFTQIQSRLLRSGRFGAHPGFAGDAR